MSFKNRKYINNSLHLARKFARMFVRGCYLFRDANSSQIAKLEENFELRKTDNVQEKISEHIFAPNEAIVLIIIFLQIFFKKTLNFGDLFGKLFYV